MASASPERAAVTKSAARTSCVRLKASPRVMNTPMSRIPARGVESGPSRGGLWASDGCLMTPAHVRYASQGTCHVLVGRVGMMSWFRRFGAAIKGIDAAVAMVLWALVVVIRWLVTLA